MSNLPSVNWFTDLFTSLNESGFGDERVVNGDFSVSSDWILGVGWSIQNGRAELASDGSAAGLRQNDVFEVGKTYQVKFDVFSDSSPIGFQNSSGQVVESATSGTVTATFIADTTSLIFKRVFGSPNGWVDNVSVREVIG